MTEYTAIRKDIAEYLAAHHRVELDAIPPESTLEDLGVDSLGVLELATLLENKFGLTLDVRVMTEVRTFFDLMELVKAKSASLG